MSDPHAEKLARAVRARVSSHHPGLLSARVVRDDAGRLRIRLQRLDAPTLAELLAAGQLSRKEGVRVVYSVASAVEALRRAELVARDLRPSRILVSAERGAVLADTGMPLELMPRTLPPGDPEAAFRSPEERAGEAIDTRSNVYSLGVLLRAVLDRPVSSGLPKEVEAVIAQATAADPEQRYAGPKEFIVAAARALGLRIRQRPGGGTELVRVAPDRTAAAAQPKAPQPKTPRRAPRTPGPPHREPAPEPARWRKPAFALPSLPRPSLPRPNLPRPSFSVPSIPRPHLRLPAVPRPRMPKLRTPELRLPSLAVLRARS
jgi:serine/threonine protein kinase